MWRRVPEGDTIFRTATALRPAMEGGRIDAARLRDRQFEPEAIVGATVTSVEARGKHLLMHLADNPPPLRGGDRGGVDALDESADGRSLVTVVNPSPSPSLRGRGIFGAIHSHMGMTGSWHIYRPGDKWRKPEHYAALVLAINELEVICFSPRLLELLTADQLRRHPHLTRLGPDLLASEFDVPAAVARFRARNSLPLGEAVMNQTIVCGIGNVYKSELLFIMRFDPFAPVAGFSDAELARLIEKARRLMRRNLAGQPRQTRFTGERQRLWAYGKAGKPCPKCAAIIQIRRQGDAGRTTYWCPECQPKR
jgi:endonuclease-8